MAISNGKSQRAERIRMEKQENEQLRKLGPILDENFKMIRHKYILPKEKQIGKSGHVILDEKFAKVQQQYLLLQDMINNCQFSFYEEWDQEKSIVKEINDINTKWKTLSENMLTEGTIEYMILCDLSEKVASNSIEEISFIWHDGEQKFNVLHKLMEKNSFIILNTPREYSVIRKYKKTVKVHFCK